MTDLDLTTRLVRNFARVSGGYEPYFEDAYLSAAATLPELPWGVALENIPAAELVYSWTEDDKLRLLEKLPDDIA